MGGLPTLGESAYARRVTEFETVRVAAVQATPVILDAEACIDKAARLLNEAADQGRGSPSCQRHFVPLYPSNAWAKGAPSFGGWDELWERLWANSVEVPGDCSTDSSPFARAEHLLRNRRQRTRARPPRHALQHAASYLGPDGLIGKHRKLMPTHHERLFHGIGAGDDLAVADTPIGRIGGLICWENRMPLARYAIYKGGPQIWVAPTADDSDGWHASMRHIAIESGAFVVSVPQYIPASAFPDDFPVPLPEGKDVFGNGGATIIEPTGRGASRARLRGGGDPDRRLRPALGLQTKRWFDAVGHYSREDVLGPQVAGDSDGDEAP